MRQLLVIFVLLITPLFADAQLKTKTILSLYNGSVIHGSPEFESVKIDLKYGTLDIPLKDILKISVGHHLEKDLQEKFEKALKDLGSNVHMNREVADKLFRDEYEHSYGFLRDIRSSDRETTKRINAICDYIRANKNQTEYDKLTEDAVYLIDGAVYKGKITGREKYEFSTKNLGRVSAFLSGVKDMVMFNNRKMDFELGEMSGEWTSSKIMVIGKFTIRASGSVDMWPSDPERYTSSPNGSVVGGKSGAFTAGTLLIRYNGNMVKCGEHFVGESQGATILEFMIERPSWFGSQPGLPPTGSYKIEVSQ